MEQNSLAETKKPPPPYDGEELNQCMAEAFDFSNTSAVVVSGDAWHPCGHMLLKVGAANGYYFHLAGPCVRPKFMQELSFPRYLRESRKRVLSRRLVDIRTPQGPRQSLTN